jgi:cytochrome P450
VTPTFDLAAMAIDPAPYFASFRAQERWAWAEPMNMWLVSRYDDVVFVDENSDLFSTEIPGALLTRTLGTTMIRQEGAAHRRLRSDAAGALKRAAVMRNWGGMLAELSEQHLAPVRSRTEFDLAADFATPYTGACLRDALGLDGVDPEDIHRWSDAFIGGLTNNTDDAAVWERAAVALAEVNEAVACAVDRVRAAPDTSIVSAMANGKADPPLATTEIASNVALMIAGGFNDARDAIATLPWLLLTHPEVATRVAEDADAFERAIDESVRWLTPVGSYPRILTDDFTSPAADLKAGDRVLVLAASANWDETRFPEPRRFDIDRPNLEEHLGFSIGVHFCLGSQLVRAMLREAVPALMALPGLRPAGEPEFHGWQFRGPLTVPVTTAA